MTTQDKIDHFLSSLAEDAPFHHQIIGQLRSLVGNICPQAEERFMYGGIVVYEGRAVCGYFSRAGHVTVELERGCDLSDTWGVLEGKGKNRRHIKLRAGNSLEDKHVGFYLEQAFERARLDTV